MKKLRFNGGSRSLTLAQIARAPPHVLEWKQLSRRARLQAEELFKAHENLFPDEFSDYVQANPPPPQVISYLVHIAIAADDPDKPSHLGKAKAAKLYGAAKAKILAAWTAYDQSPNYKGKQYFANLQAKTLKNSQGKSIAASTIYRWLPTRK